VTAAAAARIETMAVNEFMTLPSAYGVSGAGCFCAFWRRRDEITHWLSKRRKLKKLLRCERTPGPNGRKIPPKLAHLHLKSGVAVGRRNAMTIVANVLNFL
jgi:hypothetical protein